MKVGVVRCVSERNYARPGRLLVSQGELTDAAASALELSRPPPDRLLAEISARGRTSGADGTPTRDAARAGRAWPAVIRRPCLRPTL